MMRLKCKKCGNVFERGPSAILSLHLGPYYLMKCPACGKYGWFNLYLSVKDPVTWPPQKRQEQTVEPELTEEELEKKRIEESKYEKP